MSSRRLRIPDDVIHRDLPPQSAADSYKSHEYWAAYRFGDRAKISYMLAPLIFKPFPTRPASQGAIVSSYG